MKRYPGIRPFRTDEQALFFGRDMDIERLHRLIELEQLVILYGKSGYGKSSLLAAGIFPKLKIEAKRRFLEIRFGPYKEGESTTPDEVVRHTLSRHAGPEPLLPDSLAGHCIWQAAKNCQQPKQASFLLVFDQFEELFSYPPEQILEFKKQLAEALYTKVPRRFESALAAAELSPEQEDAVYTPFDLKVVFSIRSDRMSLLNGLKDYLPNLLQHGYELDALDEAGAREAMVRPAALSIADYGMRNAESSPPAKENNLQFDTPPFTYAPETLAAIFNALRDDRGRIETSALQIVCRYVEDYVVGPSHSHEGREGVEVSLQELGDIPAIFRQFYERTIANLPEAEQASARRLVEDQLVKDGVRVPYAAQALLAQPGISQDLLDHLSAASLLRVQRDEQGRMIYEVGHDTLVGPIGEAAQSRRAQEERERLQREADEQRREKDKAVTARRRARLVALGAVILSLVAIGASYLAYLKSSEASAQAALVLEKEKAVAENVQIAQDKTKEADAALKRAEANEEEARLKNEEVKRQKAATEEQKRRAEEALQLAEANEEQARLNNEAVQRQKSATEEQKRRAEEALQQAEEERRRAEEALQQAEEERRRAEEATVKVVQSLLKDASAAIYRLDYEAAADRLHDAARLTEMKPNDSPLGQLRPAIADAMLEPAYFYAESGNYLASMFEIAMTAYFLGVPDPADALQDQVTRAQSDEEKRRVRAAFRQTLSRLRPAAFAKLDSIYYPVMLPVAGGTFYPAKNYQVTLSSFRLARTETTVWQYNLYLADQGKDIFDDEVISKSGWGWEGNNPIVNVFLFDAYLYANWLSRRFGLIPAYDTSVYPLVGIDTTVNGFRLPTEAEWEFAARGGVQGLQDSFEYAGGHNMDRLGWYGGNSGSRARDVAEWQPNQLGLYDMSGNVWEWCHDSYGDYENTGLTHVNNLFGPTQSWDFVYRGGSWQIVADACHVSSRHQWSPKFHLHDIGFRLASFPQ